MPLAGPCTSWAVGDVVAGILAACQLAGILGEVVAGWQLAHEKRAFGSLGIWKSVQPLPGTFWMTKNEFHSQTVLLLQQICKTHEIIAPLKTRKNWQGWEQRKLALNRIST